MTVSPPTTHHLVTTLIVIYPILCLFIIAFNVASASPVCLRSFPTGKPSQATLVSETPDTLALAAGTPSHASHHYHKPSLILSLRSPSQSSYHGTRLAAYTSTKPACPHFLPSGFSFGFSFERTFRTYPLRESRDKTGFVYDLDPCMAPFHDLQWHPSPLVTSSLAFHLSRPS